MSSVISSAKSSAKPARRAALGLLGLGAAAAVSLVPAQPAAAQASGNHYAYNVGFTTPTNFLTYSSGDIHFEFDPQGPTPAQATITGGNLTYSNDWQISSSITTFGDASPSYSFFGPITGPEAIIGNVDPQNGFDVPVTQWGTSFGFTFLYDDPPGTDPSDFSLTLQAPGQADASLFTAEFSPSGAATLMSSAAGVTITPQAGTPALSPPAVPEASTTVSLGLLLALGLGGLVVAGKRKKAGA